MPNVISTITIFPGMESLGNLVSEAVENNEVITLR